jgi:hypothetical protein
MLKLSALEQMSEPQRSDALGKLVEGARAKPNGGLTVLEMQVRAYETKYSMRSDEMRSRVASGELGESADFSKWLMLLSVMKRVSR